MNDRSETSQLLEDFLRKAPDDLTTTQISAIILTIVDRYMGSAPTAVVEMLVHNAVIYAKVRNVDEALPTVLKRALYVATDDNQPKVH